ncbi:MAG TPA: type VI secretion system baseplate subunit TssG [Sedimenticola sp.]|nr:type VI secretion system baseplate subunit TssG [Sedimenticola sp.]
MAAENRDTPDTVALHRLLETEPYRFDFFQALRRLECAARNKPRIGASLRAADDSIRLGQQPSMAFAPSTLASFKRGDGRPPRLNVFFLGLFGPNGPLPLHLTEYAFDRMHNADDPTFARFADIFHHRILSLFYRAWARAQPTVNFDRPDQDRFSLYLGALFGQGTGPFQHRDAMPDLAKLHYAGLLSGHTRNAEGLRSVLRDFFGMPVGVEQFVGHWMVLPEECRTRLAESPATGLLGMTAVAGGRVWDRQHKFRITVGPIGLADYRRLLPDGGGLSRFVAVVRNYAGDELLWDLNLILKKEEVPPLALGRSGRLGWTSWLTDGPPARDAGDLLLNPPACKDWNGTGSP